MGGLRLPAVSPRPEVAVPSRVPWPVSLKIALPAVGTTTLFPAKDSRSMTSPTTKTVNRDNNINDTKMQVTPGITGGGGAKGAKKALPAKRSYVSMDHLTNFSLPPRQQPLPSGPRRGKKSLSQQVWNKEKFVNAQYRFVMKPTEDYTVHFVDPDIYFQWQDIVQVIIPPAAGDLSKDPSSQEFHSCPICLTSPPVAPRVTKCGHIYCFACILRYIEQGDQPKWNRCPICFDSVNESHLKCVRWDVDESDVAPSPNLKMRLMERPHITTMSLPRSVNWPSDLLPPHQAPFHFLPDVATFAKFMLATPEYLVSNLTQELDQLDKERKLLSGTTFRDDLGREFVETATQRVLQQVEKAKALETPSLVGAIRSSKKAMRDQERIRALRMEASQRSNPTSIDEGPDALLSVQASAYSYASSSSSSPPTAAFIPPPPPPRHGKAKKAKNVNPTPPPSSSSYFYYQAANGAPVFLHPLDTRILLSHFKSFYELPDEIEFPSQTLTYTASTISDDLRKRHKYLSHLPEAADVVFVETGGRELEHLVGHEGLKPFEAALRTRQGKKKEKDRKDERARLRAEERDRDAALRELTTWVGAERAPRTRTPSPLPQHVFIPTANPPGAWGARSFASTIRTNSGSGTATVQQQAARRVRDRDRDDDAGEWEQAIDAAWEELEHAKVGRGKKKAGKKLVIVSSSRGRY